MFSTGCITPQQNAFASHGRIPTHWLSGEGVRFESGKARVRIPLAPGFFSGSNHTSGLKLALQWLPCQTPGVRGSVLGLVCPVSIYCDWVRWKVWFATSISVCQRVNLSEQIRPRDTHACCWDVKQPRNNMDGFAQTILRAATQTEAANQTSYLTQSHHTNTGPTSPSGNPRWLGVGRVATRVPILKSLV